MPICPHDPPCPGAYSIDREAAHTIATHPDQGWSLLCNGVVLFDDTGEILPDAQSIPPHRPSDPVVALVPARPAPVDAARVVARLSPTARNDRQRS